MKDMYGVAIALVANAFKDVKDAQGEPYFLHCFNVASRVQKKNRILGMLHDYVEDIWEHDHEAGFAYLREQGISEADIQVLRLLTHNKKDDYLNVYIKRIGTDERATDVKLRDLEHNSDISRIKGALTKRHFDKFQIYHTSYHYLLKI